MCPGPYRLYVFVQASVADMNDMNPLYSMVIVSLNNKKYVLLVRFISFAAALYQIQYTAFVDTTPYYACKYRRMMDLDRLSALQICH
jgi:hypothetical protein